MTSPTPTVLLNSFAMAKKLTPVYKDVTDTQNDVESSTKPRRRGSSFTFSLVVQGIEVSGRGASKQKAKHSAAANMIVKLKEIYPHELAEKKDLDLEEEMVRLLHSNKLSALYHYTKEEGSSDNRIYTVTCRVGCHLLTGEGKGKKKARLDVAVKVLKLLKEQPESFTSSEQNEEGGTDKPVIQTVVDKLERCPFEDPVSVLQEYLVHSNLNPPSYFTDISERVYTVMCRAGGISHSVSARRKQLAKQCAAAGVLEVLGVRGRPKKKPKRRANRTRQGFRYPAPFKPHPQRQHESNVMGRPTVYEPSQRAINYSRRTYDDIRIGPPRPVFNYYDNMF